MTKLGIVFGGRSGEHEISLMSATSVIKAIDTSRFAIVPIGITKEGKWLLYDGPVEHIEDGTWEEIAESRLQQDPVHYRIGILDAGPESLKERIDFALPILHGPYGEDGTIQGLFEMLDLPYGGCGVVGSALAMDKIMAKSIFAQYGLPQGPYLPVLREELELQEESVLTKIEEALSYPLFVKPANLGSSVGISKAHDRKELTKALWEAASYDRRLLVEQGIACREIETAVLGNYNPEVSGVGEIIPSAEFYDYKAKYFDGGQSKLCIPADLPEETVVEIRRIARKAYEALDCAGFARVDFFLEHKTNRIYINEINTIPGFTRFSMFPLLWGQAGVAYPDLIERIVRLGYERYHAKNRR